MLLRATGYAVAKVLDLMKHFGACRLDTLNQTFWRDETLLALPPRPYAVLQYLVEHPGRLITHNEFMEALWPGTYVQPQVLRTYVLELRKLLGDDAANPQFIATVPKRGYRFLAPVTDEPQRTGPDALTGHIADGVHSAQASKIVGRDQELAKLDALMRRARGGERQVAFIIGEPGIGKTALVDAFCVEGCGEARVARGQSLEHFGSREAFYPVKEILKELAAGLSGADKSDRTQELLARIAHGLLRTAAVHSGVNKAAISADEPAGPAAKAINAAYEQTPDNICETLEALAQERPLLLVFEDLQWGDNATLDLFSALARGRGHAQLMMIATCRPATSRPVWSHSDDERKRTGARLSEDREAAAPALRKLKQDLVRRRLCSVIQLEALGRDAVREYVEGELLARHASGQSAEAGQRRGISAAGQKSEEAIVPAGLIMFLQEQSNGNPLFLSSILDHLVAQRVLVERSNGWILRSPFTASDVGVPENLREMIELDAEALSANDQMLLEAASVAGVVFPVWAAAAGLGADASDDMAAVEEQYEVLSRRVYFIRAAGHDELPDGTRSTSYVFAHPYYREVLYHRQPEVRRSRSHQRVAERLGALFAGSENSVAAEIANHYEAAGNWKAAAETLGAMAASAIEEAQGESAASLLERAIELLNNLGQRERGPFEAEFRRRLSALATDRVEVEVKAVAKKKKGAAADRTMSRTDQRPREKSRLPVVRNIRVTR